MIKRALQYLDKLNFEPMQSAVISDGACHLRGGLRGKRHALCFSLYLPCFVLVVADLLHLIFSESWRIL